MNSVKLISDTFPFLWLRLLDFGMWMRIGSCSGHCPICVNVIVNPGFTYSVTLLWYKSESPPSPFCVPTDTVKSDF